MLSAFMEFIRYILLYKKPFARNFTCFFYFTIFYQNKPGFIIPHIVYSWIGIIIIILFAIYLPIDWFASKTLKDLIIQNTEFKNEIQKQDFVQMLGMIYCIAVIFLAILTGLYKFWFNDLVNFFFQNFCAFNIKHWTCLFSNL